MVDNDSLLDLLQELRRCHEFRNVGIDDDEDGLVCDKALRFTGIDDEAFDFAALFDGFCHLAAGVSFLGKDDMRLDVRGTREVGDAHSGSERIEVFVIMSHDEDEVCAFDDFLERLGNDSDPDSCRADRGRCLAAECFRVLADPDDGLVAAAAKSEV